ncbi:hypothetical protein TNCV_88571 [Trichonephila clavipes]|nr:hypothetical protein TNCV_88571 [Trichonephila clavipes]
MTVPRVPTCGIGRDVSDQVGVRKNVRECQSIRGASRFYLAAIYTYVLERILYRNSINLSDWSRVSGRISSHGVGTRHPFRWGKRRTQQIPFVVNNNRADIKITVAIPRDRRPPINIKQSCGSTSTDYASSVPTQASELKVDKRIINAPLLSFGAVFPT